MTSSPTRAPLRVLFVCTGNSARSIFAEALLRDSGGPDFEVHSAGTSPAGLNPLALQVLAEAGLSGEGLRSKSIDEYLGQSFDYVITVCDTARRACPVFPGAPESLHWGYDDPAAVDGSEEVRLAAFRSTFTAMGGRINQFVALVDRELRRRDAVAR